MTNILDDKFIESSEFQQVLHNSININNSINNNSYIKKQFINCPSCTFINNIDLINCQICNSILSNNSILKDNIEEIKEDCKEDCKEDPLIQKQNNEYLESLNIDKAKLFITNWCRKKYDLYIIKQKLILDTNYQIYTDYQKQKGKIIKNKNDNSWFQDFNNIKKQKLVRQKRLFMFKI